MFSYIVGTISYKKENLLVLECNNIGYELSISLNTFEKLPDIGEEIKIYTYLQVKEDGIVLYGFEDAEEKELFLKLITVSGVGPKAAISILSGMKISQLISSIVKGDLNMISSVKGIGKKTAERLVVELRDKFAHGEIVVDEGLESFNYTPAVDEAVSVLVNLGINKNEAQKVARQSAKENSTAEEIIAVALRRLNS